MAGFDYSLSKVEKSSGATITQQIVELVRKNIEYQALMPGDKLPTEREMAERFAVARGTVKAAYNRLEQQEIIRTRQGSGSFVARNDALSQRVRTDSAAELVSQTIRTLVGNGFSSNDIRRLFDQCLALEPSRLIQVALIHDCPELLLDFKRQLSSLPNVSVSIFILDSVTENNVPEELLGGFDLLVIPSWHYAAVAALLPGLEDRLVEAAVTPANETLIHLTALPRDARIGLICRSHVFLSIVKGLLLSYGFQEEKILSFFEMDYTIETYFPGGIDVLISFRDAHIFTNPDFGFRNEEFLGKGGRILTFQYQVERGSLIFIEDRVRRLCALRKEVESKE